MEQPSGGVLDQDSVITATAVADPPGDSTSPDKRPTLPPAMGVSAEAAIGLGVSIARQLTVAADAVCSQCAAENRQPNFDEWVILDALRLEKHEVEGRIRQHRRLAEWRAQAGTSEERSATRSRLEVAKERLRIDGEQLQEQLASLTAKLSELQKEHREAEHAVEVQKQALEMVRKVLPPRVQNDLDRKIRDLRSELRNAEWSEKSGRVDCLRDVLRRKTQPPLTQPGEHYEWYKSMRLYFGREVPETKFMDDQKFNTWFGSHGPRYFAAAESELSQLAPQVDAMNAEYARRLKLIEDEMLAPIVGNRD